MPESSQYSVQLYTLRDAIGADLAGSVKKVADIGYTQVEPYNFVATATALAEAFAATGITAPSGHAPLLSADQDEIFAAARKLGIGTVIDPFTDPARWTSRDDIKETAQQLSAAAAKGREYGIRVGYHNHAFELKNVIDGVTGLEILAENLDPDVVLEVDTYWAAVGGQDPVALLQRLGERVQFIHVKDGPVSSENKEQVAVGAGKMPIQDILAAASHVQVRVVELDDFAGDVFDALDDSYRYLTQAKERA